MAPAAVVFERAATGEFWHASEGAAAAPQESASVSGQRSEAVEGDRLILAGREFSLQDGVWKELGLTDVMPDETVDLSEDEALPAELAALRGREGVYRLRLGDRVVEIVVRRSTQER